MITLNFRQVNIVVNGCRTIPAFSQKKKSPIDAHVIFGI